jgi:hypothetical protein
MAHFRDQIVARMDMGKKKYGHGVRVNDDTTKWGTPKNCWMEMAREEFLDAVVYVIADYIRLNNLNSFKIEDDDNKLILHVMDTWKNMEPCMHKTLLCTLFNILESDQ